MNWIDLITLQGVSGPTFLAIYFVAGWLVLRWAGGCMEALAKVSTGRSSSKPLTPYHYALLAGDKKRTILTALVRLESAGMLKLDKDSKPPKLSRAAGFSGDDPFEAAIIRTLDEPASLDQLLARGSLDREIKRLEEELAEHDLVIPQAAHSAAVGKLQLLVSPFFLIGGLRLLIGLTHGRPILFLTIMLVVQILYFAALCMYKLANHRGRSLLEDQQRQCAALKTTASSSAQGQMSSSDLALGMALFGASALAISLMPPSSGGSGCGSSCSGGGSCGGGGCGGGCGGCGG